MMRINRKADYALRAAIFLSRYPLTQVHLISDISKATGVSRDFMAKILKELSLRGIVKAQKGANGGYRLSLTPDKISFKDVIEAVEGPIEINECVPDASLCTQIGSCDMSYVWTKVYKAVANVLEEAKISDFTEIEVHAPELVVLKEPQPH